MTNEMASTTSPEVEAKKRKEGMYVARIATLFANMLRMSAGGGRRYEFYTMLVEAADAGKEWMSDKTQTGYLEYPEVEATSAAGSDRRFDEVVSEACRLLAARLVGPASARSRAEDALWEAIRRAANPR